MRYVTDRSIVPIEILKINGNLSQKEQDVLAVEEPLEISLTIESAVPPILQKNISITMRTPGSDAELAVGFLFTEGIIFSPDQIAGTESTENKIDVRLASPEEIDLTKIERHFYTSSSCGVCGKSSIDSIRTVRRIETGKSDVKVSSELIKTLPKCLRDAQEVFERTGGLHAAALFTTDGKLTSLKEDVGRHNALDKLIGAAFQNGHLPLSKHLLLLSGRASFELIQKASMAGIPFVMAVGAPSSLAVELAQEFDITLVGFLTDKRFNVYHGANRIEL